MFLPWYRWKIAHLALNDNHSLYFYNFINLYYRKNSESVLEERIRELNDNLRRKDEQISSLQRTQTHPTSTRASQEEVLIKIYSERRLHVLIDLGLSFEIYRICHFLLNKHNYGLLFHILLPQKCCVTYVNTYWWQQ